MSESLGRVVKIAGPVVDVAFAQDSLPEITNALEVDVCLLYTSPSPRDGLLSRMPSSA